MDLVNVLQPFFDFFVEFCNVTLTLGGVSFSVGTVFVWCIFATVLIGLLKGLAS